MVAHTLLRLAMCDGSLPQKLRKDGTRLGACESACTGGCRLMDAPVLMAAAGHQAGQERQDVWRQGSMQSRACGLQDLKALPQRLHMRITLP